MKISENSLHRPVLLDEVIRLLEPKEGMSYLDLTAGYGGHAAAFLDRIGPSGHLTLVDRDEMAIEALKDRFAQNKNVEIIRDDFYAASKDLLANKRKYDLILADLGVSSVHLNKPERGFSFKNDGPLDMRMDQNQNLTAEKVINEYSVEELSEIFARYGEISRPHKLARYLVEHRPYKSTGELASRILKTTKTYKKTHPATKVFQAIRIEVNQELSQIEKSLPIWLELLGARGRIGVISFHSLEDRLVKKFFQEHGGKWYDARLQIVTQSPVISSIDEVVFNPRARSAKLRVAQRK